MLSYSEREWRWKNTKGDLSSRTYDFVHGDGDDSSGSSSDASSGSGSSGGGGSSSSSSSSSSSKKKRVVVIRREAESGTMAVTRSVHEAGIKVRYGTDRNTTS
ncbi:hypothetical protein V1477_009006 [Vespula maculifrons]|uniref:Uncharacterized protein n=1 Tax=Vespula maculifrons TaxID=7453 RepID=A0ABD2CEN1_VESMC